MVMQQRQSQRGVLCALGVLLLLRPCRRTRRRISISTSEERFEAREPEHHGQREDAEASSRTTRAAGAAAVQVAAGLHRDGGGARPCSASSACARSAASARGLEGDVPARAGVRRARRGHARRPVRGEGPAARDHRRVRARRADLRDVRAAARAVRGAGRVPRARPAGAARERRRAAPADRLFEWAKFSAHDVEPSMRDEAIGALLEVRDELQANRLEDERRQAAGGRAREMRRFLTGWTTLVALAVLALAVSRSCSRAGATSRSTCSSSSSARSAWPPPCARRARASPDVHEPTLDDELDDPLDVLPRAARRAGAPRARGLPLARQLVLPAPPAAPAPARDRREPAADAPRHRPRRAARTQPRRSSATQAWAWLRPDRPRAARPLGAGPAARASCAPSSTRLRGSSRGRDTCMTIEEVGDALVARPRRGRARDHRQARRARADPARRSSATATCCSRTTPGLAKTLIARSFAQATTLQFSRIQFTPDLMPSDVTGSSIFNQRNVGVRVPAGPDLHEPPARRRDQPRPAEDAGGAARGDAGAAGDDRRQDAPARPAVPRARDAEPDRVRGHVPAARGAARPLPAAASASAIPRARTSGRCSRAAWSARSTRSSSTPVVDGDDAAAMQRALEQVHVSEQVGLYMVDLVAATRVVAARAGRRVPARNARAAASSRAAARRSRAATS